MNSSTEIILKMLNDNSYFQSVNNNPKVLESEGLSQSEIKNINSIIEQYLNIIKINQDLIKNQSSTTLVAADAFKKGLVETVEQIDAGFRSSMLMYKVAFYLGVCLIITSIVYAFIDRSSLLSIVFGSLGIMDILVFFITKPPQNIQSSRADLAQLQAAFTNWFFDTINWNTFLQYLDRKNEVTFENVRKVSVELLSSTNKTMELIEKYCELSGKQS